MATFKREIKKLPSEQNLRLLANLIISLANTTSSVQERCVEPYEDGKTYQANVSLVLKDSQLYLCKVTNQDATWTPAHWELIGNDIDELSVDDVKAFLNLTPEQVQTLSSIILDAEVRLDKTWSSSKIYTDIQQCLDDSKAYTLAELGKASGASYKVVSSTGEMTEQKYIYLMSDGSGSYDLYIVENDGSTVQIGNTTINLSGYYTKTEVDNDFLKKTDAASTYATIASINGKFDKKDILSAISSNPSNEKVLSEKAIKSELDLKANDNEVLKTTDIKTTVDIKLTDKDICSGKAIYEAIEQKKDCIGKETVLYNNVISSEGTFTLTDNVNNYDFIIINHIHSADNRYRSVVLSKTEISKCTSGGNRFFCVNGLGSDSSFTSGYFNKNKVVINVYSGEKITSITGYKFGEVIIQHTITNPAPDQSYSTSEQLTGGTWIDGKPIYRRVYTGLSLGTTEKSWTSIGVSLPSNLDKVINARAANITASTYRNDNLISIALVSRTLQYYTTNKYSSNIPNTLILEYTKK